MPYQFKKIIFLFLIIFVHGKIFAQKQYWQQQANFTISVTLNDVDNSLTGFENIAYYNHSPDTLAYIWIHLWQNAYKNDRTAFSDQKLENGSTDFYFSEENKKGYINQLNFKVDKVNATIEDHLQHQDIIKLILPKPLKPGDSVNIETPFHVKLPYNFSRGGHVNQSYQITQWYPKPAVYDKDGWHPIPYLDQGEFYSEFGEYDVKITVPKNYVVAATGNLLDTEEKKWLKNRVASLQNININKSKIENKTITSSTEFKTLHYWQSTLVHDFAWFADKSFIVQYDTIKFNDKKIIDAYSFILPSNKEVWKNSLSFIKKAIISKSNWLGQYPYDVVSIVDNAAAATGGMEYPTIALVTADGSERQLEAVINHEVGHNWFYGILATNERKNPWMDEGMNTYYDAKYRNEFEVEKTNKNIKTSVNFLKNIIPTDIEKAVLQAAVYLRKDQPINTASEKFSSLNYGLIAYYKTGEWMKKLEQEIGFSSFEKAMQAYYEKWKFKHPTEEDFKNTLEENAVKNLDNIFSLLHKTGGLDSVQKKKIKFAPFFNLHNTDKFHYISVSPAVGFNKYDKLMIGAVLHNYNLPPSHFQFAVAPLFATGTSKLNGIGRLEYTLFPTKNNDRLLFSVSAAKFTGGSFTDSTNTKNALSFSKFVPSVKYIFRNKNARSTVKKYIQFKTYFIGETNILFQRDTINKIDIITYPKENRYINQLQFCIEDSRKLYPYNAIAQVEQGDEFVRINFTGNYYFNYAKKGGLNVRFFVGKFIYTGNKTFTAQYKTDPYHLNLSGAKGYEDYTYSNYFVGRNEFEGFASQQMMNRDGFFKVRTDLLSNKIGKSDDWLTTVNLVSDIPQSINIFDALPIKIPVKLFADIGTFAEVWKKEATTGRFLYDAGLQVSLFKNVVNIYVPLFYSKVYSDYFKSTITEKKFQKTISFTIDIDKLKISTFYPQLNF